MNANLAYFAVKCKGFYSILLLKIIQNIKRPFVNAQLQYIHNLPHSQSGIDTLLLLKIKFLITFLRGMLLPIKGKIPTY